MAAKGFRSSQSNGSICEDRLAPEHLPRPDIAEEPPDMADGAPDEVARGGFPGAVQDPGEGDESNGEVGRGDGDEAEE
jgi:hypothetical protein